MVGRSDTDDERRSANLHFKIGFVLLVGVSGGLVASSLGASVRESAVVVGAGLAIGAILTWWLVRSYRQITPGN